MKSSENKQAFGILKETLKENFDRYEKVVMLEDKNNLDDNIIRTMKKVEDTLFKKRDNITLKNAKADKKHRNDDGMESDEEYKHYNKYMPKMDLLNRVKDKDKDLSSDNINNNNNKNVNELITLETELLSEFSYNFKYDIPFEIINFIPNKLDNFSPYRQSVFFDDHYIEYEYTDKSKIETNADSNKTKEESEKKNMNLISYYSQTNKDSNLFSHYRNLLHCDALGKYNELDDLKEEDKIKISTSEEEYKKAKDELKIKYKDLYNTEYNEGIKYQTEQCIEVNNHIRETFFKKNKQVKLFAKKDWEGKTLLEYVRNKKNKYTSKDVTFNINLQCISEKYSKTTNSYCTVGTILEGRLVNFFKITDKPVSSNDLNRGSFDLKDLENSNQIVSLSSRYADDDINQSDFFELMQIKKYYNHNGIYIEKPITLKVGKMYSGKSLKTISYQVNNFYKSISSLFKGKIDSHRLNYFSDHQMKELLPSSYDGIKIIIDNIDWHINLKSLNLSNMDQNLLDSLFKRLIHSDIKLECLYLDTSINSMSSNLNDIYFDAENDNINMYFNSSVSDFLIEFSLDNFKIGNIKEILSLLLLKCKRITNNFKNKFQCNSITEAFSNSNTNFKFNFPYKILAFKKTSSLPSLNVEINLKEIFQFFMEIEEIYDGNKNFGNALKLLNLKGATLKEIPHLSKIIYDFKLLNEINLSHCKEYKPQIMNEIILMNNTNNTSNKSNEGINDFVINLPNALNQGLSESYQDISFTLLHTIYCFDTPINKDGLKNLLTLFKNIINFQNIYISEAHLFIEAQKISTIINEIKKIEERLCENLIEIDFY